MRLHLGCGGQYLTGAANFDQYDTRVADARVDASLLPVADETCSEVIANHLLEHLGYTKAVYGLAEWYRVLRPGGVCIIETPDPESSFHAFLERDEDLRRAEVLAWIFGEEQAGQAHKGLFPRKLLSKLLEEAGFEHLGFEAPMTHTHRWGLRVRAVKGDSLGHKHVSNLRSIAAPAVLNLCSGREAFELERTLWTGLRRFFVGPADGDQVPDSMIELCVVAPEVMSALEHSVDPSRGDACARLGRIARTLQQAQSTSVLRSAFEVMCATVNQNADGYLHLLGAGREVARSWLEKPPSNPRKALKAALEERGVLLDAHSDLTIPSDLSISRGEEAVSGRRARWPGHLLFSREHLLDRAGWFRDMGIRCFGLGRLEQARCLFRLAISSKMEGLYSVWNMARLQAKMGHPDNADSFYNAALGFPMSESCARQIASEQKRLKEGFSVPTGPVLPGEGSDRTVDEAESNESTASGKSRVEQ